MLSVRFVGLVPSVTLIRQISTSVVPSEPGLSLLKAIFSPSGDQRSLSPVRELGAGEAVCVALPTLAAIARSHGDHGRARELFWEGLATLAASEGRPRRAAPL